MKPAKLGDVFHGTTVQVVEKKVVRKIVQPSRTQKDPKKDLLRAIDGGKFTCAVRALADISSRFDAVERAMKVKRRPVSATIRALRTFEVEYHAARSSIGTLPKCIERDGMLRALQNLDMKVNEAWKWVLRKTDKL